MAADPPLINGIKIQKAKFLFLGLRVSSYEQNIFIMLLYSFFSAIRESGLGLSVDQSQPERKGESTRSCAGIEAGISYAWSAAGASCGCFEISPESRNLKWPQTSSLVRVPSVNTSDEQKIHQRGPTKGEGINVRCTIEKK